MNILKIGSYAAAILSLAGAVTLVGYNFDRPAWKSEVEQVAGDGTKNREWIFEQRQKYIDDRKDRYEEEKKKIPKWLKDRQRDLDALKRQVITPKK